MSTFDEPVIFNNVTTFRDSVRFNDNDVELPDGCVTDEEVATSAEISASKVVSRFSKTVQQDAGADVVAKNYYIHIARAAGTLKALKVRPLAKPTGGDKQFTVDIKKVPSGTAIGSGTTLLDSVVTVSSADTDNTNEDGDLIATPTFATGDMLVILVAVSGSTGSQGQGVAIEAIFDESGV